MKIMTVLRVCALFVASASSAFADAGDSPPHPPGVSIRDQVRCTGTIYTVERSLVERLLTNTALLATGARLVPSMKDGKPYGIRLYAIHPDSIYGLIGLQNGDTLKSVNGNDLLTADNMLEAYTKLRQTKQVTVDIVRYGAPYTLIVNISDVPLTPLAPSAATSPAPAPLVDTGVHCAGDTCTIERAAFDKLFDGAALARSVRIVPSVKGGQPNGFKLYAIRPNSFLSLTGFQNGDTIQSVNGYDLSSADKALELYGKLRNVSTMTVVIERRGQPVTRVFSIR